MKVLDDKTVSTSMNIILHAGDAREEVMKALQAVLYRNYMAMDIHMKEAQEYIREANSIQMELLQNEAEGEDIEYSVLFSHAQDTLMTINSEVIMAKKLIQVFENYESRIAILEKQLGDE